MYPGCDRITGNGKGSCSRGREIDEIAKRVHTEESGAMRLSDHQTCAGAYGNVPAGDSQLNYREKSRSAYHRCHPHHGDVREQCRHAESFQEGTLMRDFVIY